MNDSFKTIEQAYPQQVAYMLSLIQTEQLHHAYCFVGSVGGAQNVMAGFFAQQLFCTNAQNGDHTNCPTCHSIDQGTFADLLIISPTEQKPMLTVDSLARIRKHMQTTPQIGKKRVTIIEHAEQMNTALSNALLKLIEEPPKDALSILTTTSEDQLLATIRSRVHMLYIPLLSRSVMSTLSSTIVESEHERLHHLTARQYERYIALLDSAERSQMNEDVHFWLTFLESSIAERDTMIQKQFLQGKQSKEEVHRLAKILQILEMIYHDMLLSSLSLYAERTFLQHQDRIDRLAQPLNRSIIQQKLQLLQELQHMVAHSVNKKMIFDYLIMAL